MTQTRRIILNVFATYCRSLLGLAIGMFCGRWILEILGEVDYGLLGLIGGLVSLVSFINGVLASGTSRFFSLSVGSEQVSCESGLAECRNWFSVAVVVHTVIPVVLVVLGYPIGVWIITHGLDIPAARLSACLWVWRFVCISSFVGMLTVPFQAMYLAHQRIAELTVYTLFSMTANAIVLYRLLHFPGDWLTTVAFFQALFSVLPNILLSFRATKLFPECRLSFEKIDFRFRVFQLSSYVFWNAWGSLGALLRDQGISILANRNFGVLANAGMTAGTTLSRYCYSLGSNLIGAFSPAIYNAWGREDKDLARRMALRASKFGTILILIFAIPLALESNEFLVLWLKEPPRLASPFFLFFLGVMVIDKLSVGQMILVNANGKIARYQMFLGSMLIATLPIAWVLVRCGFGVLSVGWAMMLTITVCSFGRVVLAKRLVDSLPSLWIRHVLLPLCLLTGVGLAAGLIPILFMTASPLRILVTTGVVELVVFPLIWFFACDADERSFVRSKFVIVFSGRHA